MHGVTHMMPDPALDGRRIRERLARRVAAASVMLNALLASTNIGMGLVAGSTSVFAAGVEFGADVLAAGLVWAGLRIASRPADDEHPYGHGRAELVSALAIGVLLVVVGAVLAALSLRDVGVGHAPPRVSGIWALLFALVIKTGLMSVKFRIGRQVGSSSLLADGWNDAVDLLSGVTALSALGLTLVDPSRFLAADHFGGCAVGIIVVSIGLRISRDASLDLMDTMPTAEVIDRIRAAAGEIDGAIATEKCRARKTGLQFHVDLHVEVDSRISVAESHAIAERVRHRIRLRVSDVSDVLVHVEPFPGQLD